MSENRASISWKPLTMSSPLGPEAKMPNNRRNLALFTSDLCKFAFGSLLFQLILSTTLPK
jgi:hypothetical protein